MATITAYVFPACAGMSPERREEVRQVEGFPRMRGDEPWSEGLNGRDVVFSPHARG